MAWTGLIRSGVGVERRLTYYRWSAVWAWVRFLAECCKRQLNQDSFVWLYFRLFTFSDLYWVCSSVFSCTVLFVSISQVIGCEDRLRNDLYCVEWGVKLYSNQHITFAFRIRSSHILQSWDFSCIFSTTFLWFFYIFRFVFANVVFKFTGFQFPVSLHSVAFINIIIYFQVLRNQYWMTSVAIYFSQTRLHHCHHQQLLLMFSQWETKFYSRTTATVTGTTCMVFNTTVMCC